MFWRIPTMSATSSVDIILDNKNYTMEELLDEDDVIQECKALNPRLINFFQEKIQVGRLLHYIVEEGQEDADKKHTFKFPFIACEIFTCEVDAILHTLVEDEELMTLLFSFLKPDHSHGSLLAGYFSKVVICLLLRKRVPMMKFIEDHPCIIEQLVELIGIKSIMEVLGSLVCADEQLNSSYKDSMKWLASTNILEMIVDKFSSSDSFQVHANVADILCAIIRCASASHVFSAKIFSQSFARRLFDQVLGDCRPKSALFYALTVCISLLDPKRFVSTSYHSFHTHESTGTISVETVGVMLDNLGKLVKHLDASPSMMVLPTTYGSLQPPLGNLRLRIIEFISVLLTIDNEDAEKELIHLGTIRHIVNLFFEYPFHNFLHHHVECIILSCLESKRMFFTKHLFVECNIVGKILEAEHRMALPTNTTKPILLADGKLPPRLGNIGHITRICNKLSQLTDDNDIIKMHLQENVEWPEWSADTLLKRNLVENIHHWDCGRPTTVDHKDDDDFKDRAFDIATFLRDGLNNDDIDEAQLSLEQDDEDCYFADSTEVIFSSLRLGDDHERYQSFISPSQLPGPEDESVSLTSAASTNSKLNLKPEDNAPRNITLLENGASNSVEYCGQLPSTSKFDKASELVERRETSDSISHCETQSIPLPPLSSDVQERDVNQWLLDETYNIHVGDKNQLLLEEASSGSSKFIPLSETIKDKKSAERASNTLAIKEMT